MAKSKSYENAFEIGWEGTASVRFERLAAAIEKAGGKLTAGQRASLEGSFFGRGEAVRLARLLRADPDNRGLKLTTSTPPCPAWASRGSWGSVIVG